jgi:hypothetical protein
LLFLCFSLLYLKDLVHGEQKGPCSGQGRDQRKCPPLASNVNDPILTEWLQKELKMATSGLPAPKGSHGL